MVGSVWLTKANAAKLIQVSHTTINRWIGLNPPQMRVPLEVGYLSNGEVRIRAASVLAQIAVRSSVIMAASMLAVEQLNGDIVSPTLRAPAGMGSEAGKVLASGAGLGWIGGDWGCFACAVGDMPTGRDSLCVGVGDEQAISPVISPDRNPGPIAFKQGRRGSVAPDWAMVPYPFLHRKLFRIDDDATAAGPVLGRLNDISQ